MGRYRKLAALGVEATIIALPPPGDEAIGLALGAAILKGGNQMEETSSSQREKRRSGGGGDSAVTRWVGVIVIGSILILAIQVGGLRTFVQH